MRVFPLTAWWSLSVITAVGSAATGEGDATLRCFIGTYTNGDSEGIYTCEMNTKTGALTGLRLAAKAVNPSFLAVHPSGKYLYAVSEISRFEDQRSGGVAAFAIDAPSGALRLLNQQPTRGGAPCHLVVGNQGKHIFVANYGGGNVAVLPIGSDGHVQPASGFVQHQGQGGKPNRQSGPHAHSIHIDAANRYVVAVDLGLDKLLVYRFDDDAGTLQAHTPPSVSVAPGAGPRHFSFHPNGRWGYVINELDSTVTAFAYDSEAGRLTLLQTITTLPEDFAGERNYPADVQVSRCGQFLFGSNRGHDSIAVYKINSTDGKLETVEIRAGDIREPRNFALDPSGQFLIAEGQRSNDLVVLRIDAESGRLTPTGHTLEVPAPVCMQFLAAPQTAR